MVCGALSENSPAIDSATGDFSFIIDDFDGQARIQGKLDIGSDEFSLEDIKRRPVTPDSVGPNWLNNPLIPKVLSIQLDGSGSVELDPVGGLYEVGTWVTLTAVPLDDWTFSEWSGDLSGTNPVDSIYIDDDKTVIARFSPPTQYKIVPWIIGKGQLLYDPPGNSYSPGTVVWVTAVPDDDWIFDSWSGALSGDLNPDSLIMDADKAIQAKFLDVTSIERPGISHSYHLSQNYPNPFNPETRIVFSIAEAGETVIEIYNSLGHKIDTILNQRLYAGQHEVNYDASHLASGIYHYRLRSGSFSQMKKMILIK